MLFQMKETVMNRLMNPSDVLKLLFATEVFGMGVNVPDIRRIIHVVTPATMESKQQNVKYKQALIENKLNDAYRRNLLIA